MYQWCSNKALRGTPSLSLSLSIGKLPKIK